MVNKLTLTIIVSIILTVILISLVNVGVSLFLERPEYEDFCGEIKPAPIIKGVEETQETCEANNGTWRNGYCDYFEKCSEEYENALKPYNQIRYYIFAGLGFILLLLGLFISENLIQLTGLATGGILVTQGIVMNFENKLIVFVSLIAILIIFGILAYRIIKKKD